jgi:uncharacterized protein YhbP (UPF0306 family)
MNGMKFTSLVARNVTGDPVGTDEHLAERVPACVFDILERNVLCSMATVTSEGHPHINTAYFSYTGNLKLYFLSHPDSEHCRNVSLNSSMAMTVFSSEQQWTGPDQGVQLFGTCEQTTGPSAEGAEQSYASRFPAYARWKRTLALDHLIRQYRFYRFSVSQLTLLDEKNFGDAIFVRASLGRDS